MSATLAPQKDDEESEWEVEVTRPDGATVDVLFLPIRAFAAERFGFHCAMPAPNVPVPQSVHGEAA